MNTLLGWLGTYLLHSTVLLGLAWLVDRRLRGRPRWQEPIWKAALVGSLLTATAQTAGLRPWGVTWTVDAEPALLNGAEVTVAATARDAVAPRSERMTRDSSAIEGASAVVAIAPTRLSWGPHVLGAWAAGALILLGVLANAWLSLRRRIRGRRALEGEPIQRMLSALASREPRAREPRLTVTPEVTVPMAMGLFRPEICVSERVIQELSPEAQESLLAHELAHVARRDPLWRLIAGVIGRALFFQPLNWLAARKMATCAELCADDWAAQRTTRPLALAECLTTVARWTVSPMRGLPVAAAVSGSSDLKQRVERLVRGEGLASEAQRRVWAGPAAWCALAALTLLAPTACNVAARPPATPGESAREDSMEERSSDEHARHHHDEDERDEDDDNDDDDNDDDRGRAEHAERGRRERGDQERGARSRAGRSRPLVILPDPEVFDDEDRDGDHDKEHDDNDDEDEEDRAGKRGEDDDEDHAHPGSIVVHVPALTLDLAIDVDDPSVDAQIDALQETVNEAREKREKAREKREKAREKRDRAREKARAERDKGREQRDKELEKALEMAASDREMAAKEREKALEMAAKERERALEMAARDRERALEMAAKERAKAAKVREEAIKRAHKEREKAREMAR